MSELGRIGTYGVLGLFAIPFTSTALIFIVDSFQEPFSNFDHQKSGYESSHCVIYPWNLETLWIPATVLMIIVSVFFKFTFEDCDSNNFKCKESKLLRVITGFIFLWPIIYILNFGLFFAGYLKLKTCACYSYIFVNIFYRYLIAIAVGAFGIISDLVAVILLFILYFTEQ